MHFVSIIIVIALIANVMASKQITKMFRDKLRNPKQIFSRQELLPAFHDLGDYLLKNWLVTHEILSIIKNCAQNGCQNFDKEIAQATSNITKMFQMCYKISSLSIDGRSLIRPAGYVKKVFKDYQEITNKVLGSHTGKRFFSASALSNEQLVRENVCQNNLYRALERSFKDFENEQSSLQDSNRLSVQEKIFFETLRDARISNPDATEEEYYAIRFVGEGADHDKAIMDTSYSLSASAFADHVKNIRLSHNPVDVNPEVHTHIVEVKEESNSEVREKPIEVKGQTEECPICMMGYNDNEGGVRKNTIITTCGHVFHRDCLQHCPRTADRHLNCPTCREQVNKVHLFDENGCVGEKMAITNS